MTRCFAFFCRHCAPKDQIESFLLAAVKVVEQNRASVEKYREFPGVESFVLPGNVVVRGVYVTMRIDCLLFHADAELIHA